MENIKLTTRTGIHAQEATQLVATASKFQCDITLKYRSKSVDAKSILGVMSLGVYPESVLEFVAQGVDASEAIEALSSVLS